MTLDVSDRPDLPPLRDDGLPTLPTGEPVLARWFVITMLLLAPVAIAVTVWAFLSIPDGDAVPPAERRPVGDGQTTIDRGAAELGETPDTDAGPSCAQDLDIVGDEGARVAGTQALDALCQLLGAGDYPLAREGLREWIATEGQLRFATFETAAVESTTHLEEEGMVIELNARFLFEDASRAAPTLLYQLVLIADPQWPGERVSVEHELAAAEAQADGCERVDLGEQPPRSCQDVRDLLDEPDPRTALEEAGFRP